MKKKIESPRKNSGEISVALVNGDRTMKQLLSEGMPGIEDTDERNEWLCKKCRTFSNVQEAINYLESLRNL